MAWEAPNSNIDEGRTVNSTIYRDHTLLGPLKDFWEESFGDVREPIIMEDNAAVHKMVRIPVRKELGIVRLKWPPNSPDLNPIENIWSYMKDIIARDYAHISSAQEMKRIVQRLWDQFKDDQWDKLIDSMPKRIDAARGGINWILNCRFRFNLQPLGGWLQIPSSPVQGLRDSHLKLQYQRNYLIKAERKPMLTN